MERSENIYENSSAKIIASKAALTTSACMDPCNPEDNAQIPKSIRQTASQESDRLSKFYKGVIGLLCAILLTLIAVTVTYRADLNKLQTDYYRCIDDKNNFTRQYSNLSTERDHLKNSEKAQIEKNQQLEKLILKVGCTSGWRNFSNHLYCTSTKALTWNDSRDRCMEKGAHLVIISSKEEQEFVANLKTNAWIGLYKNGVWRWVDYTVPIQKYWMPGEPNNIFGTESCVEIINSRASQQNWNNVLCNKKNYYICEYEY